VRRELIPLPIQVFLLLTWDNRLNHGLASLGSHASVVVLQFKQLTAHSLNGQKSDLYLDSTVILSSLRWRAPLERKILYLLCGYETG
jgi:hypothetical protein